MIASTSQNCINEQQKIDQLKLERADPGRPEKVNIFIYNCDLFNLFFNLL